MKNCILLAAVLLLAIATAHAGLLQAIGNARGHSSNKFKVNDAEAETIAASPESHLDENLSVITAGKGIKGMKKAAIAVFQVRFRRDLNNDNQTHVDTADGMGVSASVTYHAMLEDDKELYQKLTDQLYDKFAADLKTAGVELVDIETLAAQDGYKRGRAAAKENGRVESLSTSVGVGMRDRQDSSDSKSKLFSKFSDATMGVGYYVHYASKAPELLYPHSFSPDCTGFLGSADVRIVEPGPLSPGIVEAAEKAGVGLIIIGYEVRNLNYSKGSGGYAGAAFATASARIGATPSMRTQLLAVKMTKEGATSSTFYTGVADTLRASDGIQVIPAAKHASTGGLSGRVYRWIESTGPDVNQLLDVQDEGGMYHLKPGAGYEAAFWQAMDVQRSLAVAAIKEKL